MSVPRQNLTTLAKHLRSQKLEAEGLGGVLEAVALGAKSIAHLVRRARIDDVLGVAGGVNLHGEEQQKLDVLSDEILLHCASECPDVAFYASEEQDEVHVLRPRGNGGRYGVVVDPLDGSSNVDVAVSVGTIFSILANEAPDDATETAVLQAGCRQVAAGYVLYGSSVVLVLTLGEGVDMYVLDPVVGEFLLVKEGLRVPEARKLYSVNEAYTNDFDPGMRAYLEWTHASGYGSRYIGSMVADVHRTLLKGGVFLYPATTGAPGGKLRLLYEGNPMSMVVEQAGGAADTGTGRILDVEPEKLHQRTPVVLGSTAEVEHVLRHLRG